MFKSLDNNKNRQLDFSELENGLRDFGINLNSLQIQALLKHFDKDGSGLVNFDEFLSGIRGELNEVRLRYVRAAYQKLDINGDGSVKLDDVARVFDVSKHPDVLRGEDVKKVYERFMSQWET
jgi:Ca2+-binding EF-hand superfamily protein